MLAQRNDLRFGLIMWEVLRLPYNAALIGGLLILERFVPFGSNSVLDAVFAKLINTLLLLVMAGAGQVPNDLLKTACAILLVLSVVNGFYSLGPLAEIYLRLACNVRLGNGRYVLFAVGLLGFFATFAFS